MGQAIEVLSDPFYNFRGGPYIFSTAIIRTDNYTGQGYILGNGYALTAGHIVYQYNHENAHAPAQYTITQNPLSWRGNYGLTYSKDVSEAERWYSDYRSHFLSWVDLYRNWKVLANSTIPAPRLSGSLTSPPYPFAFIANDGHVGANGQFLSDRQVLLQAEAAAIQQINDGVSDASIDIPAANPPANELVHGEQNLVALDSVLIHSKGDGYKVKQNSAGLALFYNPNDLTGMNGIFGNGKWQIYRSGGPTAASSSGGLVISVDSQTVSKIKGTFNYSIRSDLGDSGSAYLLKFGKLQFVFGSQSAASRDPTNGKFVAIGDYFDPTGFENINKSVDNQLSPNSDPTNLIVGVNPDSRWVTSTGAHYALGTARRDLFVGTSGSEVFYASRGDTVQVGAGNNVVVFTPSDDPALTQNSEMTVKFGTTASGLASGNTVVEVDPGSNNHYVLDLSGFDKKDVEFIAHGQFVNDPNPYTGEPREVYDPLDTTFEALTFKIKNTGQYITYVTKNMHVGAETHKSKSEAGIAVAKVHLPSIEVLFKSKDDTTNSDQILEKMAAIPTGEDQKNPPGQSGDGLYRYDDPSYIANVVQEDPASSIDQSPVEIAHFQKYFGPNLLNTSGQSTVSLQTPNPPLAAATPQLHAEFAANSSNEIVVTGQASGGAAGGTPAAASSVPDPTILYGTTGTDTLDPAGTYSTVVGNGGGDTFVYKPGYGPVTIDEIDVAANSSNVLQLAAGLTPAMATLSANVAGDVLVDFGNGDSVTLTGELLSANGIS